jgi:hypothetical protein
MGGKKVSAKVVIYVMAYYPCMSMAGVSESINS